LREQDKNARVMEGDKFQLLQKTIGKDKRLESLPLVAFKDDSHGEFQIISGHHRVRAARMAGLQYIFCLVDESSLSEDRIKSKQLAHNSIQGHDDVQTLKEIFESIEDIEAQIDSGISAKDIMKGISAINIDEMSVEYETEVVSLLFTEKGFKDFKRTLEKVEDSEAIYLADHKYFDEFVKVAREVSMVEDIRNMTGIVAKMCEIVNEYYRNKKEIENVEEDKQSN